LVNFPKLWEMTISKPTFAPIKKFYVVKKRVLSGANDSTRVRRHTGIIRRARVKIFISLMGAFGSNFPDFRAIWLGTTKPKLQNLYEATNQNIRTFTSTKGYLWLTGTSWIDSAPSEPSNSNMFGRYRPGGGQMPNSDRSAQSINFGLFLRKAGGISNLMRTLQNLDLSTTARNFLGPFSESARNFRLSGRVRTCK
jgi:hypothetical protein